jgi:hypothetical protein
MPAKIYSLIVFFCFLSLTATAQTYSVLHTEGTILQTATQTALKTGDTFKTDDSLTFPRVLAWAVVISPKGDLMFVQNTEPSTKLSSQVMTPVERGEHPIKRSTNIPVKDLKAYFKGNQFVFIGNDFSLPVDSESYPLDEKLFLLYRYEYNSRIITHKLPVVKGEVVFNPVFLYEYKGEKIPYQKTTHTELSYFDSNTNFPTFAADFQPIWLNDEQLKKELTVLLNVYRGGKKFKETKVYVNSLFLSYVKDIYGQTDEFYFSEWVQKSFFSK